MDILNREEADYRRRIELKFSIRKREILRLMNLRAKKLKRPTTSEIEANGKENVFHEADVNGEFEYLFVSQLSIGFIQKLGWISIILLNSLSTHYWYFSWDELYLS